MPKVVVVTGGTSGVGRASVRLFARKGCHVAVLARGRDGLEATRREVEAEGVRCLALSVDVSDAEAVDAAASQVEAELGPIDIWVNNAVAMVHAKFLDITPEEFKRVMDVTFMGYVWGTRAALRRMAPRNRGTIVLVGSGLAYRGVPLMAPYSAAKHAIQGMYDALRTELLHEGHRVRLTMVQLPGLNTPLYQRSRNKTGRKLHAIRPAFQPEVAARAVVHAAFHGRREYVVGESALGAILLDNLMPNLADWVDAWQGWRGQFSGEPEPPGQPDALFTPLPGDPGVRGPHRAYPFSPQAWLNLNRRWLAGVALGAAAAWWALRGLGRPSSRSG